MATIVSWPLEEMIISLVMRKTPRRYANVRWVIGAVEPMHVSQSVPSW
jgi:hypothetical protein